MVSKHNKPKKDGDKKSSNHFASRLWNAQDAGQWLDSGLGVVGTNFEFSGSINALLEMFEEALSIVETEGNFRYEDLLSDWVDYPEGVRDEQTAKKLAEKTMQRLIKVLEEQKTELDAQRITDGYNLYNWIQMTRGNIDKDRTAQAAWTAAMATQAAMRLKGRIVEPLARSGYKHSVVAPAKRTEWHDDLLKAAKRHRKNGVPDKKMVQLLLESFSSKSKSTIYRVLTKHGFFS